MKAAIIAAPGELSIVDVENPTPAAGEVVIEVLRVGICGTDLHVLDGEHRSVRFPVIAGHEFAGRVVERGPQTSYPDIGDLVAVDPMIFCGHCGQCRDGWTNLCENGGGLGTTRNGAFAEYVAVSAQQCQRLTEEFPWEWGILVEPLSCALHAVDRIGATLGKKALVIGAGPMGLLLTNLLSHAGALVDVSERSTERLQMAEGFGARRSAESADSFGDSIDWDIVIDATGNPAAIAEGLRLVRRAGSFGFVGLTPGHAEIPLSGYDVVMKELTIVGSNSVRHSFRRAVDLLASGSIAADSLLEPAVPLADISSAFEQTRRGLGLKHSVLPSSAMPTNGGPR